MTWSPLFSSALFDLMTLLRSTETNNIVSFLEYESEYEICDIVTANVIEFSILLNN